MVFKIRNRNNGLFSDGVITRDISKGYENPGWCLKGHIWKRKHDAKRYLQLLSDMLLYLGSTKYFSGYEYLQEYLSSCEIVSFSLDVLEVEPWEFEEGRTDHLIVQCLERDTKAWGRVTHIKVRRADGRDGITWDDLWAVKNEYGFEDSYVIEVHPPKSSLVYETNMRHLWVVPEGIEVPDLLKI